jgi:adenosylcobinamide-phosphate synthase
VVGLTGVAAWGLWVFGGWVHPLLGDAVGLLLIYFSVAGRDLAGHGQSVQRALEGGDVPQARRRVAMLVSRDTEHLGEPGIARATVESVAENLVDGLTAPLLFAASFGPVGAMVYRAVNTLDAMFGYRNERYREFGWAAARLDDAANYVPARLTGPLLCLLAPLVGGSCAQAWATMRRDHGKHPSPNGGWSESAVAGALGVQLGGENRYFGAVSFRPLLGENRRPLVAADIGRTIRLVLGAGMVFALFALVLRLLVLRLGPFA